MKLIATLKKPSIGIELGVHPQNKPSFLGGGGSFFAKNQPKSGHIIEISPACSPHVKEFVFSGICPCNALAGPKMAQKRFAWATGDLKPTFGDLRLHCSTCVVTMPVPSVGLREGGGVSRPYTKRLLEGGGSWGQKTPSVAKQVGTVGAARTEAADGGTTPCSTHRPSHQYYGRGGELRPLCFN